MITALDHLVMTVQDIQATISFMSRYWACGQAIVRQAVGRLRCFRVQKINLHGRRHRFAPMPASLCRLSGFMFLSNRPGRWQTHLAG